MIDDGDVGLARQLRSGGGVAPSEVVTVHSFPTRARIPASGVTIYGGVPLYQSSATLSASGPITASS